MAPVGKFRNKSILLSIPFSDNFFEMTGPTPLILLTDTNKSLKFI